MSGLARYTLPIIGFKMSSITARIEQNNPAIKESALDVHNFFLVG